MLTACSLFKGAERIASLPVQPKRVRVTTNSGNTTSIKLHCKLGFYPLACFGLYGCYFDPKERRGAGRGSRSNNGSADGGRRAGAPNTADTTANAKAPAPAPTPTPPTLVSAATLWNHLTQGGWEWSGCEGGGVGGENSVFNSSSGGSSSSSSNGESVSSNRVGSGGYGGGLPLLSIDWVVMECTLENLVMLEEKRSTKYAVVLRKGKANVGGNTQGGASATANPAAANAALDSFSIGLESERVSGSHFYAHIYTGNGNAGPESSKDAEGGGRRRRRRRTYCSSAASSKGLPSVVTF